MAGENNSVSGKRRKFRISRIIILLLIIAIGAFAFYRINLKYKLKAKIEAIRAAGYPVTLEEMDQWYPIPKDGENAAELILETMYENFQEPDNEEMQKLLDFKEALDNYSFPLKTKPYSEENLALINQFLKDNENALEGLYKASAIEYSRYPEDFMYPNQWGNDSLLLVLNGIKILNLQAAYFSEMDDSKSALQSITSSFGIINSLSKDSRLIFYTIWRHSYRISIINIIHIINSVDFTDEQLMTLNDCLTPALDFSDFPNLFIGEMCRKIEIICNNDIIPVDIISDDIPLPLAEFYIFFYNHLGIADIDRTLFLEYMIRYIEAAKLPLQERYNAIQEIDEQRESLSRIYLLNTLLPGYNRDIERDKKVIAQIQAAKVAIAAKRYSLAKGTLPDAIEDLIPEYLDKIPVTPDEKELKYKKIEEGCIIYSEENEKTNINNAPPQNDLIKHGIPNLGIWFIIEY